MRSKVLFIPSDQWQMQDFLGDANSLGGGAPRYDFAKMSRKLHEIERIWMPWGGVPRGLHKSANGDSIRVCSH